MSRPYSTRTVAITYFCPQDESVLHIRTHRRVGDLVNARTGERRLLYERGHAPFAEDLMTSLYRLHRWTEAA